MTAPADVTAQSLLERIQRAVSRTVVVYTVSGRAYAGTLRAVDRVSIRLESRSEDFEAPCIV